MKPNQQFQMMISMFLENRQKSVSNADLTKHLNNEFDFYAISRIKLFNNLVTSQTEPFSEQQMIMIGKGGSVVEIGDGNSFEKYLQQSPLEFTNYQGNGLLHWTVKEEYGSVIFTVVKLMSPDGMVQIKLIHQNQLAQTVYNVCEMPSNH